MSEFWENVLLPVLGVVVPILIVIVGCGIGVISMALFREFVWWRITHRWYNRKIIKARKRLAKEQPKTPVGDNWGWVDDMINDFNDSLRGYPKRYK